MKPLPFANCLPFQFLYSCSLFPGCYYLVILFFLLGSWCKIRKTKWKIRKTKFTSFTKNKIFHFKPFVIFNMCLEKLCKTHFLLWNCWLECETGCFVHFRSVLSWEKVYSNLKIFSVCLKHSISHLKVDVYYKISH